MTYIGRTWLYWRNLTFNSIGRISLLLAEYDFHWQNVVYTGWLSLLLVEYDLYWQNMTSIGRIWFILAYYHSYWQNMQPIKSVLSFCSALPIQYTPFHPMSTWHAVERDTIYVTFKSQDHRSEFMVTVGNNIRPIAKWTNCPMTYQLALREVFFSK